MSTESFWDDKNLGQKIADLLASVTYVEPNHHFGRPFLTAYQLAVLFKQRFPEDFDEFGHPLGGKGSGVQFSLTSYLARQLSGKIKNGEITNIEGRFLSNLQLLRIQFVDDGETVTSSLPDSQYDLSMFRLRNPCDLPIRDG